MPGTIETPEFKNFTAHALHPTFAAEIKGVDWKNVTDETFSEIQDAVHKVRPLFFNPKPLSSATHEFKKKRIGN